MTYASDCLQNTALKKSLAEYHKYSKPALLSPLAEPVGVGRDSAFKGAENLEPTLVEGSPGLELFKRNPNNEPVSFWQNLEALDKEYLFTIDKAETKFNFRPSENHSFYKRYYFKILPGCSLDFHFIQETAAESNIVLFFEVEAKAKLSYILDSKQEKTNRSLFLNVKLHKEAELNGLTIQRGAKQSIEHVQVDIHDQAIANFHELVAAADDSHNDLHIVFNHIGENTKADHRVLHLLSSNAFAAFTGKIDVGEKATNTDSNQSSKTILLSDQAKSAFRPQLEILNKDVKCSHGATSGKLDANALFYLKSRGIPAAIARKSLIDAELENFLSASKLYLKLETDISLEKQVTNNHE